MTQGELEKIPDRIVKAMNDLEIRIMDDVVRRIKINGFSTAGADWQVDRLRQLGMSEKEIKEWIRQAMEATEGEIDRIFSDEVYEQYMKQGRGYKVYGREQIPFEENFELQQLIEAVKRQANDEMEQITGSMGFVRMDPMGRTHPESLSSFYTRTLDDAMYDIHSGAFDYNTVLKRTIEDMTKSGLRWIDYESGWHNRVPVAARRAVMTGFRQVQGKINEQTAEALGTDSYEVTVHIGARPTHQVWEGKIWTMTQLRTVCGLGEVTGLHGANCYHDYNPFIPGVDIPAYSQEELDQIHKQENTPKRYNGKEYTTYQALQRQRKLETRARKYREDVHLLEEGGGSEDDIIAKKCRYQGTLQEYRDFSKKMDLPMQKERIYQDGLKVDMNRLGKENSGEKYRVRSYEKAPYYTKDTAINACRTTDEIRALFPETAFLKRFEKLPFEVQKEIAQGFNYMRKSFGSKAMPLTCNTSKMDDYGKTQLRLRKIMVKDSLREDEAFSTACHESIHVFDYNNGLISEKVLPNAFKSLGIKSNSREADTLVLDLLGYKLYNKYRNDNAELMAYAFEERLYNSDNKLVNAIIQELERYLI